jgi:hypothetical protein
LSLFFKDIPVVQPVESLGNEPPVLLALVTTELSWTRNWCKLPFDSADEVLACWQRYVDGSLDDVARLRSKMWMTRKAVAWKGSVVRVTGKELALLPFALEPAFSGLVMMRQIFSLLGIFEIVV